MEVRCMAVCPMPVADSSPCAESTVGVDGRQDQAPTGSSASRRPRRLRLYCVTEESSSCLRGPLRLRNIGPRLVNKHFPIAMGRCALRWMMCGWMPPTLTTTHRTR